MTAPASRRPLPASTTRALLIGRIRAARRRQEVARGCGDQDAADSWGRTVDELLDALSEVIDP